MKTAISAENIGCNCRVPKTAFIGKFISRGARNPGDPSNGSLESEPGYPSSRNFGLAWVACRRDQILQLARLHQHPPTDPHRLDLATANVLTDGPRGQADGSGGFLDTDQELLQCWVLLVEWCKIALLSI